MINTTEANSKKSRKHPHLRRLLLTALLLFALFSACSAFLFASPRRRLLLSTLRFATETLQDSGYIAYDIDLMELCREYLNADTVLSGEAHISHVRGFDFSMSLDVSGERSFSQKKMAGVADLRVLFLPVGDFDFYAADKTAYIVVPMLDGLSYAFDTDMNLFPKAPELTHDLDRAWFSENAKNIIALMHEISFEETEDVIEDEGQICRGYLITIPEGAGGFIWELLGMDPPTRDISATVYLTPLCKTRRIVIDLTKPSPDRTIERAVLTIDGTAAGTVTLEMDLPDDERAVITAVRNGAYSSVNFVDLSASYETFRGETLTMTGYMTWERTENGTDLHIHDILLQQGTRQLLDASYNGHIEKQAIPGDVFRDAVTSLSDIDIIKWKALRNDVQGFVDDVMAEVKSRVW